MSRPVHLCYVGDGTNYHVKKWLPSLVRSGMKVTLVTFDVPETPLPGVRARKLSRPFRSTPSYGDYLIPVRQLKRILNEEHCDVLMGSYATHYGWLAARVGFHPFVLQTWTGDLTVYPFRGIKRFFYEHVVRYALDRADLVTTDGRALLEEGVRLFPQFERKMIATRWGIEADVSAGLRHRNKSTFARRRGIVDLDDYVVVTAPRGLQHWYQPELLISSLLRSLESDDRLYVVLLTLGHSRSGTVGELLQRLSAHPRSLVVDEFLSREEINELWSATDIIISVPHADGISESVLEAAYSGAFPILSDISSNRSLVEDGLIATLVESDVSSITDALESAIARPRAQADVIRAANESWILRHATIDQTATDLADRLRVLAASCREKRE